jgi:hypothetical protein
MKPGFNSVGGRSIRSAAWRDGIVLGQITHEDVGLEADHRRLPLWRLFQPAAAPAAIASFSRFNSYAGWPRLDHPHVATESFGSRTTVPSGRTKNLTWSPGFNPKCSRIAFGLTFGRDRGIHRGSPPRTLKCNTMLGSDGKVGRFAIDRCRELRRQHLPGCFDFRVLSF